VFYENKKSSSHDFIQPLDTTLKRKSKMRSIDAAAIARLRSSTLPTSMARDDTNALIEDDVHIVFNERTAL